MVVSVITFWAFVTLTQIHSESSAPLDPATAQPEKAGRFHQLDGLRAVAVLLVLMHHSITAKGGGVLIGIGDIMVDHGDPLGHIITYIGAFLVSLGASGVELFFVLSGIVLLRPYLRGQRKLKVASYFRRRAERLWPPYLVVLLLEGIVIFVSSHHPNAYTASRAKFSIGGWASQLGIMNFGWDMYNGAWWSLTIELIFYLVAPLIVPVFASRAMTRLIFVIVMVLSFITAAIGLRYVVPSAVPGSQALLMFSIYLPCFLFGVAIAKYDVPRRIGGALAIVGAIYVFIGTHYSQLNVHAGFGVCYAGLTILAFDVGGAWMRFLSRPTMVWMGERSYSLFLIHFTVFAVVNYVVTFYMGEKSFSYFFITRAFEIPGAFLASMLLFWFVERRFARNLVTADQFWPWSRHREVRPLVAGGTGETAATLENSMPNRR